VQAEQLAEFRGWFDKYVAGFYSRDAFVNANIELKQEHSLRVCEEMSYLSGELGLSANEKRVGQVIALFHDIGRFEQFVRYRTYADVRSVDHALLGLDVLKREGVLEPVAARERRWIETAIGQHNAIDVPAGLNGQSLRFCRLIRDADKLDIYYVVTEYYQRYMENPEEFRLEVELPDEPGFSEKVVEGVLRGERIEYSELRTWNDMKILQLGWVYDINFAATLRRLRQRRLLERLVQYLPQSKAVEAVVKRVFAYVDSRIKSAGDVVY